MYYLFMNDCKNIMVTFNLTDRVNKDTRVTKNCRTKIDSNFTNIDNTNMKKFKFTKEMTEMKIL